MQHTSHLLEQLALPMTIEMSIKSRELAAQGKDVISLSLGEPDFDTPDFIKDAAKQGIDENFSHYMPVAGFADLREAIAKKFKRDNNLDFTPEQIVVSTGAKQSLANVILALVNPGEEIIIPAPFWVNYVEQAKLAGAKSVVIETSYETDFKITPDQLREAMNSNTRLMIFSSPNNPSGMLYTEDELRALAEVIATKKDFYVMFDEIYELINYGKPHFSMAAIDKIKDQVITVNGLSKGFAMTGWRLGYIGAPTWIAKACDKIQSQFTSGTCSIAQRAAIAAVSAPQSAVKYMVDEFEKRKNLMVAELNKVDGLHLKNPDGAFYAFVDVRDLLGKTNGAETIKSSMDVSMFLLNDALVSSVPGEAFGLPGYIRFSYAASEEKLREACKRVANSIQKLH